MRTSTRDESARPSVKTHYRTLHDNEDNENCDAYSEMLLELRERVKMNPVHHYHCCIAIQNVRLHFSRRYYGGIKRDQCIIPRIGIPTYPRQNLTESS